MDCRWSSKKRVYRLYCQEGPQLRIKPNAAIASRLLRGRPKALSGLGATLELSNGCIAGASNSIRPCRASVHEANHFLSLVAEFRLLAPPQV